METRAQQEVLSTAVAGVVVVAEVVHLKAQAVDLLIRVSPVDADAAAALIRARSALFEAWTILCAPPQDEDDHDH